MAQKRDISGLLKIMRDGSQNDQIKAIEVIADLGDTDALKQALENLSVSTMSGIWDRAISSVTRLPNADATRVLVSLLVSDIEVGLQERVLEALLDLDAFQDAETWAKIGETFTKKNCPHLALKCFDQALKIEPTNKELIFFIAVTLFDKSLFEQALRYFKRFSELDPNDERGWGGQGLCLANLERLEEARAVCLKALEIKPSYKPVRDALCGIYYQLRDYMRLWFHSLWKASNSILLTSRLGSCCPRRWHLLTGWPMQKHKHKKPSSICMQQTMLIL